MQSISTYLTKPQNAANLGLLRIGLGLVIFLQFVHFLGFLDTGFFYGQFRIPYHHLEFIRPLSKTGLEAILHIGLLASVLVIIGWASRVGFVITGIIMGYFVFLDKLIYNNHYYLFTLLCFLMAFTHSDARFSIKNHWKQSYTPVPQWQYLLIALQVFIVFFYGGLAKMNVEWLSGNVSYAFFENHFTEETHARLAARALAISGLLFDLGIGFMLFWKKTRNLAFVGVILFNLTNGLVIFDDIGLFPYAMLVVSILPFADRNWVDKIRSVRFSVPKKSITTKPVTFKLRPILSAFFIIYFLFQFSFPLRHHFLPGNPEWTGVGHHFSWRMKSFSKKVELKYYAFDRNSGKLIAPINDLVMDSHMMYRIGFFPHNVWVIAQEINRQYEAAGRDDIRVGAHYRIAMNGKHYQEVVSVDTDLGRVPYSSWAMNDWVLAWDSADTPTYTKTKAKDSQNKVTYSVLQ